MSSLPYFQQLAVGIFITMVFLAICITVAECLMRVMSKRERKSQWRNLTITHTPSLWQRIPGMRQVRHHLGMCGGTGIGNETMCYLCYRAAVRRMQRREKRASRALVEYINRQKRRDG